MNQLAFLPEVGAVMTRTAKPEDLPEVLDFMAQANRDTYTTALDIDREKFESEAYYIQLGSFLGEKMTGRNVELNLLYVDNYLAGSVGLDLAQNCRVANLWGVRVGTMFQRAGLGDALIERAMERAYLMGANTLSADVNNATPGAQNLYRSWGMKPHYTTEYESLIMPAGTPDQAYTVLDAKIKNMAKAGQKPEIETLPDGPTSLNQLPEEPVLTTPGIRFSSKPYLYPIPGGKA